MKVTLPEPVYLVLSILTDNNYESFIVGGAVRDLRLETDTKDWDFTTDAKPEEIQKL